MSSEKTILHKEEFVILSRKDFSFEYIPQPAS